MGRVTSGGIDAVLKQLDDLGSLYSEELPEKLLQEGADIVVDKWKESAGSHMVSHTGDLVEHIDKTNVKKMRDGRKCISIYPKGAHSQKGRGKRKRNADVAFILNYSSRYPRQNNWINTAETRAEPLILQKWQAIADKEISKIGGR